MLHSDELTTSFFIHFAFLDTFTPKSNIFVWAPESWACASVLITAISTIVVQITNIVPVEMKISGK